MPSFWMSFKECGVTSFLILLLGIVGFVAALASLGVLLAVRNRRLAIGVSTLTLLVGVASLAAGAIGQAWGRHVVDQALSGSGIAFGETDVLRTTGYHEAQQCMNLGEGAGALPCLLGLVLLGASFLKKEDGAGPDAGGGPKFGA
ncbi:MAG TPA: hypothetical protein VF407_24500 [Polyangiaceae bacterium]